MTTVTSAQVDQCRRVCEAVAGGELDVAIVGGDIPDELSETLDAVPYAEVRPLLHTVLPWDSLNICSATMKAENASRPAVVSLGVPSALRSHKLSGAPTLAAAPLHASLPAGLRVMAG